MHYNRNSRKESEWREFRTRHYTIFDLLLLVLFGLSVLLLLVFHENPLLSRPITVACLVFASSMAGRRAVKSRGAERLGWGTLCGLLLLVSMAFIAASISGLV